MLYKLKYLNLNKLYKEKYDLLNSKIEKKKTIQIWKFNHQWKSCYENLYFYKKYKKENSLPDFISNLSDLHKFPIINKQYILNNYENILHDFKNSKFTLTGGTSGEIIKFPTSFINEEQNFVNKLICRNWIKSSPKDKTLYIWGHSHKFGNNLIKKNLKILINKFKDFDQNRKRLDAYDMSEKNLQTILYNIKSNRFNIIFSYGSTFEILSKYLLDKNFMYEKKIKIIFTSENLSKECLTNLMKIFPNSQIIGEYGMAETGIVAYSLSANAQYNVIWTDFIIQNSNDEIILSDISNKYFPLINYSPDDKIYLDDYEIRQESIISFKNVKGKKRPFFNLKFSDGTTKKISLIIFDHLTKNINEIYSIQYYIEINKLYLIFTGNLISTKLNKIIFDYYKKGINNIEFIKIEFPIKTISGKLKTILDEKDFNNIKHSI